MTKPTATTYLKDLRDDADREYVLKLLDETRALGHADSLTWQLETIKHLAILNAAGLAAAAAMIGAGKLVHAASIAAALCGIGLLLAVVLMLARWKWGEIQTRRLGTYRWEISRNERPVEDLVTLLMPRVARVPLYMAAVASLLLFASAIIILFIHAVAR